MSKKKKKRKNKHGGSGPPPQMNAEAVLEALVALRPELEAGDSGRSWGEAHKLFLKTSIDASRLGPMVIGRDLALFDQLIRSLQGVEEPEEAIEPEPEGDSEPAPEIPVETLRKAIKAFRRRLKLTKLDMESKLGVGPMSGGRTADFESILPPNEFPAQVWKALAADGRLEATGRGFYKLPGS